MTEPMTADEARIAADRIDAVFSAPKLSSTLRAYADMLDRKAPDGLREAVKDDVLDAMHRVTSPEGELDEDGYDDVAETATDYILTLIQPAVEPVPDDMVMVPREPTITQLDSALHEIGTRNPKESKTWLRAFYRAMLSATPTGDE